MKQIYILTCLLGPVISLEAQQRATGAQFNATTIAATPIKLPLSFRSFRGLPTAYSLEKFCPTPGDQGQHGTCVAFANGYGVATILYAINHNITDRDQINQYAFSPTYLYEQIKHPEDGNCQKGSDPVKAIITMIEGGDALLKTVPYQCGIPLQEHARKEAANYKLKDAAILFAGKGLLEGDTYMKDAEAMIDITKKAILEGTPVSTGFYLPESFFKVKSDTWYTVPEDSLSDWKHAAHAMVVVGYDDLKAGGAFRVMNSWGTGWGDGGFIWIRYADYAKWCVLALQVFGDPGTPSPKPAPSPQPSPQPAPQPIPEPAPAPSPAPRKSALSGSLEFKMSNGANMPVSKTNSRNLVVEEAVASAEDLVAYTMVDSYGSGTKFRFYLNIEQEAYIYAFASDLTGKVNRILPYDDLTSTHVGRNSVVAFPSDTKVIKLDGNKGSDYLLILFSTEKLDVAGIAARMNASQGGLSAKIKQVLGNKLIDKSLVRYEALQAGFKYEGDQPGIVPLMIEISHH